MFISQKLKWKRRRGGGGGEGGREEVPLQLYIMGHAEVDFFKNLKKMKIASASNEMLIKKGINTECHACLNGK